MGTNVDGTSVWDQLASNDYISDYYTNTPVSYGFSPPIPMCGSTTTTSSPPNSIPSATSYQITIPGATNGSVNERSGPGTSYSIVGTMGDGTGIQIACQTSGTDVNGTRCGTSSQAMTTSLTTTRTHLRLTDLLRPYLSARPCRRYLHRPLRSQRTG